jgi:hypothetical protein
VDRASGSPNHRDQKRRFGTLVQFEDVLPPGASENARAEQYSLMIGADLGGGGRSVVASMIVSA